MRNSNRLWNEAAFSPFALPLSALVFSAGADSFFSFPHTNHHSGKAPSLPTDREVHFRRAFALPRLGLLLGQNEIWTNTRFEVIGQVKGRLPQHIVVRTMGGKVGPLRSLVDGVPAFQPSEEVYLFLWGPPNESLGIVGWSQGTFRIRHDPQSGMETVSQDSAGMPLLDPITRQYSLSAIPDMPLPDFLEKLRKESARSRK